MHIVHMRQDFKSLEEALKDKTGVAVLGFFYEVPLLNVFFIISVRISYSISRYGIHLIFFFKVGWVNFIIQLLKVDLLRTLFPSIQQVAVGNVGT